MQEDFRSFFLHARLPVRFRRIMIAFVFLFSVAVAYAQSPAFFRYGKESGLACEEIYEVKQDRFGFIWIASDRGVFRYDGYTFQPFTTAQGLPDNTVFRLYEDFRGRMWLMSFDGRLSYIENDRVTQYEFNDTLKKHFPGLRLIRSVEVNNDGSLRIGMLMDGLVEISASGKLTELPVKSEDKAKEVAWARKGKTGGLLIGTAEGTGPPGVIAVVYEDDVRSAVQMADGGPSPRTCLAAITTASGTVYFAAGSKMLRIDPDGSVQSWELPARVFCIMEDREHGLWIATNGSGILRYAPGEIDSASAYDVFYPGEVITSIVEDTDGSFWVATHHNGLLYVPSLHVRAWSLADGDESNDLLADPQGKMYVLWRDHGLTEIDHDTIVHHGYEPERGEFKTLRWNARTHEVMICTGKLLAFDTETGRFRVMFPSSSNSVTCAGDRMYMGRSWNLWSASSDGIFHPVRSQQRLRPDVLFTDMSGTVWLGTLEGLYKVIDTTLEAQSALHPLLSRRITAMCEMTDSTLVIATQSNGIAFMRTGTIRSLTQDDGFPCDHIYGITAGDGNTIWCSTKNGLYRIVPGADEITYSQVTAIQSVLGKGGQLCYVPQTHQLWACDGNRIISFDPGATVQSDVAPPIYIRTVQSGDSVLSNSSTAQLNYDENKLRISFCGIAFRLQGHVQYRYRLKGNSDAWQLTDQTTVEFAALEAGEYTFEVEAQNENGTWSSAPAVFSFVIVPAFWERWWFIALAAVVCTLLMYVIIVARFRMIRRGDLLREQALIFRQQALSLQMNPHFIFNALNTIQSFVLKEEKTKALDMFSSFATLLRKSLEHSTERYITLAAEVEMLRLYFGLEEMRFEGQLTYGIGVEESINPEEVHVPAMLVQPMVENALHHGVRKKPGGGKVEVRFFMRGGQLFCEVDDNGTGRSAAAREQQHTSAGIRITRDRLRVLGQMNRENYTFEIIDKTDEATGAPAGTLVRFAMPNVDNKHNAYEETNGADSR